MPLIKTSELYRIAEINLPSPGFGRIFDENYMEKKASSILNESYSAKLSLKSFAIFLSHSFNDALLIIGLKYKLEEYGFTVFVDWDEKYFADRSAIDTERAKALRFQMQRCKTLIYVTSKNSAESVWMPWELGYFDGYKEKVAIMPLNPNHYEVERYVGHEYLGIYPYIIERGDNLLLIKPSGITNLEDWVNE